METRKLAIERIDVVSGTQGRATMDWRYVAELEEMLKAGQELPPLSVMSDGGECWLYDGFHRYHALFRQKRASVVCEVEEGSLRDAWMASLRANQKHGMRRTNEDKRKIARSALEDALLKDWSDRKIAEYTGIDRDIVAEERSKLPNLPKSQVAVSATSKRAGRDGKQYPVKKIKKKPPPEGDEGMAVIQVNEPAWEPPAGVKKYADKFDPPDEPPVAKQFTKAKELLGQLIRLLDDIQAAKPNAVLHDQLFQTLESANYRIEEWRKK